MAGKSLHTHSNLVLILRTRPSYDPTQLSQTKPHTTVLCTLQAHHWGKEKLVTTFSKVEKDLATRHMVGQGGGSSVEFFYYLKLKPCTLTTIENHSRIRDRITCLSHCHNFSKVTVATRPGSNGNVNTAPLKTSFQLSITSHVHCNLITVPSRSNAVTFFTSTLQLSTRHTSPPQCSQLIFQFFTTVYSLAGNF